MDWRSTSIPLSIRRPWTVFVQDLEDKFGDAASQGSKASKSVRLQVAMVQTHGVLTAFLRLPEDVQRFYAEVFNYFYSSFQYIFDIGGNARLQWERCNANYLSEMATDSNTERASILQL